MKKILYVTTVSRTINAFLIPHIDMLVKKGCTVHCSSSVDKELDSYLDENGVKFFEVPFTRNPLALSNIKAFKRLVELQEEYNYDAVHVHTPVASIYGRLLKLKFPKLKTIYTAHGYHFLKGGSKLGWLIYYPIEKIMAKLTDITININKEDYDITKNKLKPKESFLIEGVGLDLTNYKKLSADEVHKKRSELNLEDDDFIVLMIAELNKNKNQIQLIDAMDSLRDKYPKIKALLVGEGSNGDALRAEVKNRGLDNNVVFLGFRTDITELINISNIGILLSYREGLPRSLMELMACGRKIIATDIRGCRDIVANETVGSLVKVGDSVETTRLIEKYYLENDTSFTISDELKKYDVENIRVKLFDIYTDNKGGN